MLGKFGLKRKTMLDITQNPVHVIPVLAMLISKIMSSLYVKHYFSLPVISFASSNNFNAQFV